MGERKEKKKNKISSLLFPSPRLVFSSIFVLFVTGIPGRKERDDFENLCIRATGVVI